jgi:hypothetical protein
LRQPARYCGCAGRSHPGTDPPPGDGGSVATGPRGARTRSRPPSPTPHRPTGKSAARDRRGEGGAGEVPHHRKVELRQPQGVNRGGPTPEQSPDQDPARPPAPCPLHCHASPRLLGLPTSISSTFRSPPRLELPNVLGLSIESIESIGPVESGSSWQQAPGNSRTADLSNARSLSFPSCRTLFSVACCQLLAAYRLPLSYRTTDRSNCRTLLVVACRPLPRAPCRLPPRVTPSSMNLDIKVSMR